jgi:hypothetical protein
MSLWRLFKDKKTPEEIAALREARKIYNVGIKTWSDGIIKSTKAKLLTPETASEMSKLLIKDKQWLKETPNAELEDIITNYENLGVNLITLQDNDKVRIFFLNYLKLLDNNYTALSKVGAITKIQYDNIKKLIKDNQTWYDKNKTSATELDYDTKIQTINDAILEIGVNPDTLKEVEETTTKPPDEVEKVIIKDKKKLEELDNSTITYAKAGKTIGTTALNIVSNYLVIILQILAGCLAANMAIGRMPIYRLLYFIYGIIPFFTPIVLLYTLYRRIRYGPVPIYAILPVSLEPATTRLGRYLWYPFYWIPDQESMNAYGEFQNTLRSMLVAATPSKAV